MWAQSRGQNLLAALGKRELCFSKKKKKRIIIASNVVYTLPLKSYFKYKCVKCCVKGSMKLQVYRKVKWFKVLPKFLKLNHSKSWKIKSFKILRFDWGSIEGWTVITWKIFNNEIKY